MNERIRDLQIQAFTECKTFDDDKVRTDEVFERFAELIVRECVNKQMALARNYEATIEGYEPVAPEFLEGTINGLKEGCELILQNFGVKEIKGWVCPRCGVDRTKTVCPQGYTATIEGKCPMIGVAQ